MLELSNWCTCSRQCDLWHNFQVYSGTCIMKHQVVSPVTVVHYSSMFSSIFIFHNLVINVSINTLRPRQNGRHFADDIFKCIFLNENVWIPIKISLSLFLRVQLTISQHWFRLWLGADQPLSGPMMVRLPTHIFVTRPQWVNVFIWWICNTLVSPACHLELRLSDIS